MHAGTSYIKRLNNENPERLVKVRRSDSDRSVLTVQRKSASDATGRECSLTRRFSR